MTHTHRLIASCFLSALVILSLNGCAGYRVGNIGGQEVQGVKSVYVPMVKNITYTPDIQSTVTSAIVRRFDNDGTLETQNSDHADSRLDVTIVEVSLDPLRSTQQDVLVTAEYQVRISVKATFTNYRTGHVVFKDEHFDGYTQFYVAQDIQEGKRQALPQAAEDLAKNVVKRITEGW